MAGLLDDPENQPQLAAANAPLGPQTASLPPEVSGPGSDMGQENVGLPGLLHTPAAAPPTQAGPTGRPEYFPFDPKTETGTDYLRRMLPYAAAARLPPNYRAEMMPQGGFRPNATVAKSGAPSEHAFAGALDVNIYDDQNRLIPNEPRTPDTTGHYGNLARGFSEMMDPKMAHWLRWGNFFNNPYRDIQHYDWAGEGPNGPLWQMATGQPGPARQAQAAPVVPTVTGRPP